LNAADADVAHYLKVFTFMPLDDIDALVAQHDAAPQERAAQRALAAAVTELVHGEAALASAQRISAALFAGQLDRLTAADFEQLRLDGMEATAVKDESVGLLAVLAESGLAPSRGAARKLVDSGGVSVNGVVQHDSGVQLDWSDAAFGRYYLLRRGKKAWHLVYRAPGRS
jgi:tyrosyl-tRNA synthetase